MAVDFKNIEPGLTRTEQIQEELPFYNVLVDKDNNFKSVVIDQYLFIEWLSTFGYCRYDIGSSKLLVRITDKVIEEVDDIQITDTVIKKLLTYEENLPQACPRDKLIAKIYSSLQILFSKKLLYRLNPDEEIHIQEDTKDEAFVYYRNGYMSITKDKIELKEYKDLDMFIWKNAIQDMDIKKMDYKEFSQCNYYQFMNNIAGNYVMKEDKTKTQDPKRGHCFEIITGYLLHGFFDTKLKMAIFTDARISEHGTPEGRSGKSLYVGALGRFMNATDLATTSVEINGKSFKVNDRFRYQEVAIDTKLIAINDAERGIQIEELFPDITEGLSRQRKNEMPIKVQSKMALTTNLTVEIAGGSARDRVIQFEMADYYSDKYSPADEFDEWFFRDWDEVAWQKFYNIHMYCIQQYLKYDLQEPGSINLDERHLLDHTKKEFVIFMDQVLINGITVEDSKSKYDVIKEFKALNPDYGDWLKLNTFSKWMKLYGEKRKGVVITTADRNGIGYYDIKVDKIEFEKHLNK